MTLAKIQVTAIFPMEDMRRNVFPKFIEICMGRHVGAHIDGHLNMAAGNQQKHLSLSFATKAWIYFSKNSKTYNNSLF